jgi:hypothetical protein
MGVDRKHHFASLASEDMKFHLATNDVLLIGPEIFVFAFSVLLFLGAIGGIIYLYNNFISNRLT